MFLTNEKKSTLIQIVNYGKTTFDKKKKIWKARHDVRQPKTKPLEYLKIQETYGLKISQSIIYVKGYFSMFFSTWKILY